MSYMAEVQTAPGGKYYSNNIRFKTQAEANDYGIDLMYRWTSVIKMRVASSKDEPTDAWRGGMLQPLEAKSIA